jgi:hypothetical protein
MPPKTPPASKPPQPPPLTPTPVKSAQIKPANDAPPKDFNTKGMIVPQNVPVAKGQMASLWDDYIARRERILAEQNAKTQGERFAEFLDLIPSRAATKGVTSGVKQAHVAPTATTATKPTATATTAATPKAATPAGTGGYSLGAARNQKGKCGEWLAKQDLHDDGFTDVMEVQNKSGHGVDVMGRNANGDVRVLEVKTTDGTTAPALSKQQGGMGGKDFVDDRLKRAANADGHYKNSPEAKVNALKGQRWLQDAATKNKKVSYEKYDMFIEDPKDGCIKKSAKSSPWDKKTPPSAGRRK